MPCCPECGANQEPAGIAHDPDCRYARFRFRLDLAPSPMEIRAAARRIRLKHLAEKRADPGTHIQYVSGIREIGMRSFHGRSRGGRNYND